MAYDEELANRIRECVQGEQGLAERRMFGGLAFLINGNMAVSEIAFDRPGAASPFGESVSFPIPTADLTYQHPTDDDKH